MNNISMKNVIMGSVLAVAAVTSLSVNAAPVAVCSGIAAGDGKSFVGATGSTNFVKQSFTPKCSANVFMDGEETSATVFRAGAASLKGKQRFGGSTVGGAVANMGACDSGVAAGTCGSGDATKGLQAASES